jgi:hypothetical protein
MDVTASTTSNGQQFIFTPGFQVNQVLIDPVAHTISRNNSSTLGVDDAFAKASFQIYPNPTSDYITIKSGTANLLGYEIYDLSGRCMVRQNTATATHLIDRVKVPSASALYMVKVRTVSGDLYRRLMVR